MAARTGLTMQRSAELTADESRALDLKIEGKTVRQIAALMNVPRSTAYDFVKRALERSEESMAERGAEYRELQAQRAEELIGTLWPYAKQCALVEPADPDKRSVPEATFEAALKATDRILKLMERQARLMGLDAPNRVQHSADAGEMAVLHAELTALVAHRGEAHALGAGAADPGGDAGAASGDPQSEG